MRWAYRENAMCYPRGPIADGSRNVHDLVADSFRYFADFLPVHSYEWRSLRLSLGSPLLSSLRWKASDFERSRILDPAPSVSTLDRAYDALRKVFPAMVSGLGRGQASWRQISLLVLVHASIRHRSDTNVSSTARGRGRRRGYRPCGKGFGVQPWRARPR